MTRVLLVDDEPLVLIGMQGMLNWAALGYEVVGTARNGAEALRAVQEKQPDIVVSDIRMPVMDGFALAEACHKDGSALPAFIMLTSYEEFDYVKRSMRLGVVDYLVKIDLTADSLTAALEHARDTAEKEKKLRMPSPAPVSLDTFRDRLFLQLYGGMFTDRAVFDRQCAELGVTFKAPRHIVAVGSLQTPDLPTSQLVTLSTGVTRMAAETLPKYRPCRVTAMDLRHFSVLLPLEADEDPETVLAPILKTAGQILYNYFSTAIYWAVGRPVNDILKISESQHDAFAALPLLHEGEPVAFYHESPNTQLDHRAQVVGQVRHQGSGQNRQIAVVVGLHALGQGDHVHAGAQQAGQLLARPVDAERVDAAHHQVDPVERLGGLFQLVGGHVRGHRFRRPWPRDGLPRGHPRLARRPRRRDRRRIHGRPPNCHPPDHGRP